MPILIFVIKQIINIICFILFTYLEYLCRYMATENLRDNSNYLNYSKYYCRREPTNLEISIWICENGNTKF